METSKHTRKEKMYRNVFLQFGMYKVTTISMTNFSIVKMIDFNWSKKNDVSGGII